MYRASIKIEKVRPEPVRGATRPDPGADLYVQVQDVDLPGALEKVLRILNGEQEAVRPKAVVRPFDPDDEEEI